MLRGRGPLVARWLAFVIRLVPVGIGVPLLASVVRGGLQRFRVPVFRWWEWLWAWLLPLPLMLLLRLVFGHQRVGPRHYD